jgi:hypothetical protein
MLVYQRAGFMNRGSKSRWNDLFWLLSGLAAKIHQPLVDPLEMVD